MANLAPTQIEQLQKIGSYLCQQRQNQGLSLDFVANQTFIRPVILQALESGRYEDLPQPIFIQGFIRRYADSLGLDGKALSQEFSLVSPDLNPVYDVLSQERKVKGPISNGTAPVVSEQLAVPPESPQPPLPAASSPRRSSTRPVSSKPVIPISAFLFLGLGLAVLGVGWFLWKGWGESVQSTSTVAPKENLVSPPGVADTAVSTPSPPPVKPIAPIVVKISLSDRSWLTITADGKSLYEGMAQKGYLKTWAAQKSLMIRAGNAGAVGLTINGDRETMMGELGAVKTLTLTPSSTAATIQTP